MRSLSCLLLPLLVSTASAGVFPITSFAPDTARAHARADTVSLPVWVGIQVAPVVGDSWVRGEPRTWDAEGTPWLAMSAAWPWSSPHEVWLGVGYERWRYELRPEAIPFPGVLLPILNPVKQDQATVRTGLDQLIARAHRVSGALGVGGGLGVAFTRIGQLEGTDWSIVGETFARGLLYVRLSDKSRVGAGALGGPSFDLRHGGDPLWHWELEFHVERSVGGSSRPAP